VVCRYRHRQPPRDARTRASSEWPILRKFSVDPFGLDRSFPDAVLQIKLIAREPEG
jgi:hypothetical protein